MAVVRQGTIVKNTSGGTRFFGYLGAHGVVLANNAEYSEPGDLRSKYSYGRRARMHNSFIKDLDNNVLTVKSFPEPVLYDPVALNTKAVAINDEELGIANPGFA